jgi:hypothetical protein
MKNKDDDLNNEELTSTDLDYLDFTGILPDTLLEHDSPYLSAVLLVDNVLKAETKQESAYNLAVLIQFLCTEREPSAQRMIQLYMTQQATSYTPMALAFPLMMCKAAEAELNSRKKGRKR